MIKYALVCDKAHEFESWFRDSAAYDVQARRGQVACPMCNSIRVCKAIMSPSVAGTREFARPVESEPPTVSNAPPDAPAPVTLLDERHQRLRKMIREVRAEIMAHSDDVGRSFPEEARKIHEGEAPKRSIYGQASGEEIQELLEEGIGVMPMPGLPEERN